MIIKVCGITRLEDALESIRYGANALGFNFYPSSPRYLCPEVAQTIAEQLPSNILLVAIVVTQPGEDFWEQLPFKTVQLHGVKTPTQIPTTKKDLWIATSPSGARLFPHHDVIIDTSWGTGTQADWTKLEGLRRTFILSGGLTPENVAKALDQLNPAGLDVCSGVEKYPGIKDGQKLRKFLTRARERIDNKADGGGQVT